ncbi:hypothetical protein V866_004305 [Kwoniella sp. B9012]
MRMTSTQQHHHTGLHNEHDTRLVPSEATQNSHVHQNRQHEDTSYDYTWSIQMTEEELEYLKFFQQMIPHIFSSPYHYELAIAPAVGYERAKKLSYAMVTPITHDTFSYVSPDGRNISVSGGFMRKEFVEQELPPNGDIP